jgi:2-dehydro-3-deoxyphosphooctonate aldolase (KDO 8-P synthase)
MSLRVRGKATAGSEKVGGPTRKAGLGAVGPAAGRRCVFGVRRLHPACQIDFDRPRSQPRPSRVASADPGRPARIEWKARLDPQAALSMRAPFVASRAGLRSERHALAASPEVTFFGWQEYHSAARGAFCGGPQEPGNPFARRDAMLPNLPATIGPWQCGPDCPPLVIAGPCVIETEEETLAIARRLAELTRDLPVRLVFKASFDKANRTSAAAFRGPGEEEGLAILGRIRDRVGLPVTTDVHLPAQAAAAGAVCDLLQIPAFLCRQTDLLVAAAETGRPVNVKKGQFVAPADMRHAVAKLLAGGCRDILLCERGTFFGYGRLVNDFTGLITMRSFGVPVIFDATHSVQQPASLGGATGGDRTLVEPLARAAAAVGVDGYFFETHPEPSRSPSDGATMIPLDAFRGVLERVLRIHEARRAEVEGERA